ncbi:MAG: DUF1549 and DUF1553 domain-containing protein [Planctomycetes bacterium]|nr:DUF1549 and DUF1553 domain-containing protein [Planctomycetota bacterium]
MKHTLIVIVVFMLPLAGLADPPVVRPFEIEGEFVPANPIDELVLASLRAQGIEPANRCSDEVFVRRVYLDVIGTLPEPDMVNRFLESQQPNKRAVLIDYLLLREEFPYYWALKWCDLLRVKAEFPINLWPNAVQAYHRWIRDAIAQNKPYDQFARELLTSSGSNFRVPPVNFYRAIQGQEPATIARTVALTFMGVRLESWPADRRQNLETFFSRIAFKRTAEWKEEIVYLDPAPADTLETVLPNGTTVLIPPGADPRQIFADWLISPDNPWFARNMVNRVWAWLMGRGIIHEPDDIRPDNPAVNPELLAYLEKELVNANYDLRHIYRLILNSRTYQQYSLPRSDHPDAAVLFAYYSVRQLDAEVLIDALCWIFGPGEQYSSPIPEPFTYIPENQRTIALADGSISSQFLEMFGRPARDTGLWSERDNQPSKAQRLHLLNSTHIQRKIEDSWRLRNIMQTHKRNPRKIIQALYVHILARYPTPDELDTAADYFKQNRRDVQQAANDLAWALINTKEFLYRH